MGVPLVLDALLWYGRSMAAFLIDSVFFNDLADVVSKLILASPVNVRLGRPQINVI